VECIRQIQYSMNGVCSLSLSIIVEYRVTLSFYGELNETPQTFSFSFLSLPPVVLEIHPITRTPLWGIATLLVLPVRVVACTLPKESNLTYVVKSIQVKLKDTESLAFLECAPSTPVDTIVDLHNVNCSSSIITRLPSLIDVTSTLSISFCCGMVHF